MARPASSEGDQFSLFQQLLSAATRPSPIKVMFNRDELEVSHTNTIFEIFLTTFHVFGGHFLSAFQAAAVSVCQYLVSEVHKPVLTIPDAGVATPDPAAKIVKRRTTKKVANTTTPSALAPAPSSSSSSSSSQAQKPPASTTATPAPGPLVSQIMEMGFPRRHIEYAMQTTQSNNLERLVSWLLDHANLEVPELASPPATSVPAAPEPSTVTPPSVSRQPGRAAASRAAVVVTAGSDSSSDSSDYSDDEGEDEDDGDGEREREREGGGG